MKGSGRNKRSKVGREVSGVEIRDKVRRGDRKGTERGLLEHGKGNREEGEGRGKGGRKIKGRIKRGRESK